MTDRTLAFVDVETGGLDPEEHALLEVAVVRVDARTLEVQGCDAWLVAGVFADRICGRAAVTGEALALHGLDGLSGLSLCSAWDRYADAVRGAALAGYNLPFDLSFLERLRRDVGGSPAEIDHHCLDVATLAVDSWAAGDLESCSLRSVASALGVEPAPPAHRAMADVRTTIEVYRKLRRAGSVPRDYHETVARSRRRWIEAATSILPDDWNGTPEECRQALREEVSRREAEAVRRSR